MKVKIKTLKELIDEFGEPKIGQLNGLIFNNIYVVGTEMLKHLGKEITIHETTENDIHDFCWYNLYHKPEKKKLYAYKQESDQEVIFHATDGMTDSYYDRAPEYDIEYNND